MNISNSEKILIVKVGLSSREFRVKCVIQWLGLILLVPVYYFSQPYWEKIAKQVIAISFL